MTHAVGMGEKEGAKMEQVMELEAVYRRGVLKPLKPLGLPENQQVLITLRLPAAEKPEDVLAAWQGVYAGLSAMEVAAVESIALDRSHFMPQRS